MHEDEELVEVSPRHSVRLAAEYVGLIKRPPRRDFVVRVVARREVNRMPLMTADIVIASEETREIFPAARTYPLHFRKTYHPGRLHGDPKVEFELQREASELIGQPPPIGYAPDLFRTCLLPGVPYSRLSPFDVEPDAAKLRCAAELSLPASAGLYRLLEDALSSLTKLHEGGIVHGDTELHNFIVCPSPLEMLLIDFELAMKKTESNAPIWERTRARDLQPLLRQAVLLQCSLGPQTGTLGETAMSQIDALFAEPDSVRRAIENGAARPA